MFKHILVPVDGSISSRQAVEKTIGLAKAFDSAVTVIYVMDPYPFTGVGTDFAYGQTMYLNAATSEANEALHNAKQALVDAGLRVTTSIIESHSAWRGILETAASIGADLIVMGSHGRRGIEKLMLGSVAQRVLSHATLPVLVVRG
jgi:nucleotide-binding universal stress UspA family protein